MIFIWFKIAELYVVPTVIVLLLSYFYGFYKLGFVNRMWCDGSSPGMIAFSIFRACITGTATALFVFLLVAMIVGLKTKIPEWFRGFCKFISDNWGDAETRLLNLEGMKAVKVWQKRNDVPNITCRKCEPHIHSVSIDLVPKIKGDALYLQCPKCHSIQYDLPEIIFEEEKDDKEKEI